MKEALDYEREGKTISANEGLHATFSVLSTFSALYFIAGFCCCMLLFAYRDLFADVDSDVSSMCLCLRPRKGLCYAHSHVVFVLVLRAVL